MFCGRRAELGRANEREIRAFGGEATYHRADVRAERDVSGLVAACVAKYGRIDVAVNNAGIETPRPAPLHEQPVEDFDGVWRTNARGVFLSMKYELPQMLRQRGGVIVNTASISAEVGFATIAPYNASKHAVASLTKVAALEYAARTSGSARWRRARSTRRCCGAPPRGSGSPTSRSPRTTPSSGSSRRARWPA